MRRLPQITLHRQQDNSPQMSPTLRRQQFGPARPMGQAFHALRRPWLVKGRSIARRTHARRGTLHLRRCLRLLPECARAAEMFGVTLLALRAVAPRRYPSYQSASQKPVRLRRTPGQREVMLISSCDPVQLLLPTVRLPGIAYAFYEMETKPGEQKVQLHCIAADAYG